MLRQFCCQVGVFPFDPGEEPHTFRARSLHSTHLSRPINYSWLLVPLLLRLLNLHSLSTLSVRKKREASSRAAYRFQESLKRSFSSCSSGANPTQIIEKRDCKRHCYRVLTGLRSSYDAISKNPAKVLQNRMASYSTPKKQKLAHQNFTGINF